MVGAGSEIMGGNNASTARLLQPFSFTAAIDELSEELASIQQELSFCRKEAHILKTET